MLRRFDLTGQYESALSHVAVDHVHERVLVTQWVNGPGGVQTTQLLWLDMAGRLVSNFTFDSAARQPLSHQAAGVAVDAKGDVYAVSAGSYFAGLLVFDSMKAADTPDADGAFTAVAES